MRSSRNKEALRAEVREAVLDGINEEVCDILRSNPASAAVVANYRHSIVDEIVMKLHDRFRIGRPRRKAFESNPS